MQHIRIDRAKSLADDPATGHNRWHPDIPPLVEADEGEEVVLETRDASDGFVVRGLPASPPPATGGRVHPLTGPVYCTAVYTMILAMPYHYLPLYQR